LINAIEHGQTASANAYRNTVDEIRRLTYALHVAEHKIKTYNVSRIKFERATNKKLHAIRSANRKQEQLREITQRKNALRRQDPSLVDAEVSAFRVP
jgi:hypothetical protein